ncbi:zinc ABC transporter substrate-binding protein [Candidatus Dojkabacteria bacterium]|uniref:Zinc ABC transporter substrate-binding protein n=1 Tax=Candidatus Dojkabacteria bacterium TaxID=2099670 RepID=A0A955RIW9_9BACT|nr:zinc ABC transporter substrate-binding protein [Candidatus Dojkabacteria bacterium]
MNNKLKVVTLVVFFALLTWGVFLLAGYNQQAPNNDGDFTVAVSIFPLQDIVKNIAGESSQVVQVLPTGVSPHTYEPTIQDKSMLENADIVFYIGGGLDNWMIEGASEEARLVDLSKYVNIEEDHDQEDDDANHEHEEDPHYWLSMSIMEELSKIIADELGVANPQNIEVYEQNSVSYIEELKASREDLAAQLESLVNKKIITFHGGFDYFADDFGLEVAATIEEFPGKEPSPAYLSEVASVIEQNNLNAIFKEPQLSDSIITPLAQDYGIEVYTLDPLGGVEDRLTYIELMEYNVRTIITANTTQ